MKMSLQNVSKNSTLPGTSVTNWTIAMDAIERGRQFGTKTLLQIFDAR